MHSKSNNVRFLIDNIFVPVWSTGVSINDWFPMGTNCAPLLADLFLHAYEADFLQGFLKNKDRKFAKAFIIPASAIEMMFCL